jgi:elongation factor 3
MKKKTQLRLYNAQIMMLDEPTNHMDVKKVQELVDYLNGLKEVTCLIVSHDTNFLDNVCTDILHYETRKLVSYKGNLSAFVAQKPEAKSYFELKSSQGLVWNFPDPGFLEGIKTTTKAIAKCTNITFVRSVGLVGILRETCVLLNFTSPPF